MKKAIVLLVIILASCSAWMRPEGSFAESLSKNVFKITLLETAEVPMASGINSTLSVESFGTAWIHRSDGNRTLLITAGHICETSTHLDYGQFGKLRVASRAYTLLDADGTKHEGVKVIFDDDEVDLCMVSVPGSIGKGLRLADKDPPYAADVTFIGAPHGIWGGNIALIFGGKFSGRGKLAKVEFSVFTLLGSAQGASGSPIFYEGRVVGVLSRVARHLPAVTFAAPWDSLRDFISRAESKL